MTTIEITVDNDLIYRSAVINILNADAEALIYVLKETDIIGTERARYEWGLGLIEACITDVKELSPASVDKDGENNEYGIS